MAKNISALDSFGQPMKGGWNWNDISNQLEYSSGISADRQNDRKAKDKRGQVRGGGGLHGHFQDGGGMKKQMDQRGGTPGSRAFGRQLATGGGQHGQGKRGKHAGDHTHITVEDVKEVSLNRLSEMESVSEAFEALALTPQFDEFLRYLLNYFHWFFEKRAQDTKPNPMNIEPSRAEIQLYAELCDKLESARKQLGRAYCILILGIGLHDHHHMSCGKSRVSSTYKDRQMYETMYAFLTFLVWISFKRKEYEVVKKEIGRILRTDTFNPAIRVKMAPPTETPEESADGKEKEQQKKLTPAEYRRLHGKRPPIKSIINQRSLVLVSIMPDPREEADWLFRRSGALSPTALSNMAREDLDDGGPSYRHLNIDPSNLKLGIIGEPCSQFNPITLTPLGLDTEEEEDAQDRTEQDANEKAKATRRDSAQKQAPSRQATAVSTVTTDAHLSDED